MSDLWKKNSEDRAQKAITRLLKARNKDGWHINIKNHIDFYGLCGCAKTDKLDFIMSMEVLSKMKENNLSSVEEFGSTYFGIIEQTKKQKRFQWTSFIPFKLSLPNKAHRRQITLFGVTFEFHPLSWVRNKIGASDFENMLTHVRVATRWKLKDLPNCWLTCKTSNVDFVQSWRDIGFSLYGLRSLIELSTRAFTFTHSFPFQPRFALPFPLYVIGISDSGHQDFYYFQKLYDESKEKPFRIQSEEWNWVKSNAKRLKGSMRDNSIELLIANCLRMYSQSLDDIATNLCLLSMWQMAETITLSQNFGGLTEKVCNRLSWFGQMIKNVEPSTLRDALSVISHNRNEIVHSGRDSDIDQRMIHILQIICTFGLLWLLNNLNSFGTVNDLELFYQCRTKNNIEIQRLEKAIKTVKKTRRRAKMVRGRAEI